MPPSISRSVAKIFPLASLMVRARSRLRYNQMGPTPQRTFPPMCRWTCRCRVMVAAARPRTVRSRRPCVAAPTNAPIAAPTMTARDAPRQPVTRQQVPAFNARRTVSAGPRQCVTRPRTSASVARNEAIVLAPARPAAPVRVWRSRAPMTPAGARAPVIPMASAKPRRDRSATPSPRDASLERPVPTATAAIAPAPGRARRATWRHLRAHAPCFRRTAPPATVSAPEAEPAPAPARARPTALALSRRPRAEPRGVQPRLLRKPPGRATQAPATCRLRFLVGSAPTVRARHVPVRKGRPTVEPVGASTPPVPTQITVDPALPCVPRTNTAARARAPVAAVPWLVVAVSPGTSNPARAPRHGTSKWCQDRRAPMGGPTSV